MILPLVFIMGTIITTIPFNAAADGDSQADRAIEKITQYLKARKVGMPEERLKAIIHRVYNESEERDIDYRLALAVITVESNFKHDAVSNMGARGLFQLKPSLAKYIAKDAGVKYNGEGCLQEPDKNIKLGVYHLSKLVEDYKDLQTVLHAYNVGVTRANSEAKKGLPKTNFTKKVLKEYRQNMTILPNRESLD
jgi:soluble lytic murein transglycosylase